MGEGGEGEGGEEVLAVAVGGGGEEGGFGCEVLSRFGLGVWVRVVVVKGEVSRGRGRKGDPRARSRRKGHRR